MDDDKYAVIETQRQVYLAELAHIIEAEKLTPSEATQLMFGEIASWLMVLSNLLMVEPERR